MAFRRGKKDRVGMDMGQGRKGGRKHKRHGRRK